MPQADKHLAQHELENLSRRSSAIATAAAMRSDLFSLPAWAGRRRGGRPHREQVDHKTADAVRAEGQERHSQVFSPIVERARLVADLGIKGDVHMLRHSTGYNDALMMLRLNMADPHLMSASRRQLRLTTSMSFSSSRCARCSRVRRAAFVGRRGVERRALFVFQWLA
jgi:hypothetical protein